MRKTNKKSVAGKAAKEKGPAKEKSEKGRRGGSTKRKQADQDLQSLQEGSVASKKTEKSKGAKADHGRVEVQDVDKMEAEPNNDAG